MMAALRHHIKQLRASRARLVQQILRADSELADLAVRNSMASAEFEETRSRFSELERRVMDLPHRAESHCECALVHADVAGLRTSLQQRAERVGAMNETFSSLCSRHLAMRGSLRLLLGLPPPPVLLVQYQVTRRALRCLSILELLVPPRMRQEEVGDAMEIIHGIVAARAPGWRCEVAIKMASTSFWVVVNAVREVMAGVFGQRSA